MLQRVRRAFQPLWHRQPHLRSLLLDAIDLAVRPLLAPFRLARPDRNPAAAAVEARTDEFNRAAEQYFQSAGLANLDDKPFSEPDSLSRRLIDVGVLIDGLRLRPGDRVLELGAGTCWLSHMLNRYGCRTVAVDVSATALAMGRALFERDPHTNWTLEPAFVAYDGRTIPLPDATIDRVVLYDAFHHLPNPRQILREIRRILTADGIVAMSEPGRGHTASASSHAEAATGVLEMELALEDLAALALDSGFAAAHVVVATNRPLAEVDAADLRRFMGGRGFARYWKSLCAELDGHHYVLLFAGHAAPATDRPKQLKAVIRGSASRVEMRRGQAAEITLRIYNAGDTTWKHEPGPGWTRLGAHLYRHDAARTVVDFDWLRLPLPTSIQPEQAVDVRALIPPVDEPGDYEIAFDLVVEGQAWFADRGSVPLIIRCIVR
jgi:SAM-dependent methyltransferase